MTTTRQRVLYGRTQHLALWPEEAREAVETARHQFWSATNSDEREAATRAIFKLWKRYRGKYTKPNLARYLPEWNRPEALRENTKNQASPPLAQTSAAQRVDDNKAENPTSNQAGDSRTQ